ncbi:hypothetical protein MMC34_006748 [Xylographa carneopallida]|nr:hypothetical protein [Xylographa carneopallida]
MAPRPRPQLSITLPRNFTFHYTEGEEPKTPERETAPEEPEVPKPPSPHAYRIRRRTRPSVALPTMFDIIGVTKLAEDIPIPTIEIPASSEPVGPILQQFTAEPAKGYLAPFLSLRSAPAPRTPSTQRNFFGGDWETTDQQSVGEAIARPMSVCSILSDSSDDSYGSSEDCPSLGGSCTSPESDAADPFRFPLIKKGKSKAVPSLVAESPTIARGKRTRPTAVHWTPEMDRHIWTTYMIYLQDPTMTPFKMLPGSPPPLGVCHRITREAKRTWRNSKLDMADSTGSEATERRAIVNRGDSPDTIKPERSGSSTPTTRLTTKPPMWPKSNSATRRRLRFLCKNKATIAPHYQRLLQSRSPTPFTSSSRSHSYSNRMSTPPNADMHTSPFSTRDIQVSLTTSTATTMQRDAPLAQLTQPFQAGSASANEWFNDPSVPWASPAPVPSEVDHEMGNMGNSAAELPRLGSPFGYHTWGPSRSRQHLRPTTPRTQSDMSIQGPRLASPVQFGTFPYPSTQKRRAQHQLEEELSPGGTDLRRSMLEEIFRDQSASSTRRVRSRGFTVGDVTIHDRLTALFASSTDAAPFEETASAEAAVPDQALLSPLAHADSIRRLGSPFNGISSRPSRSRGRHAASASLSSYDPNIFSSIDQRLGETAFQRDTRS